VPHQSPLVKILNIYKGCPFARPSAPKKNTLLNNAIIRRKYSSLFDRFLSLAGDLNRRGRE
jgi:hypothetical protein